MSYNPTPHDPWQQEGSFPPNEPPPQPGEHPPTQPGYYSSDQPAGSFSAQPGEYPPPQPAGYPGPGVNVPPISGERPGMPPPAPPIPSQQPPPPPGTAGRTMATGPQQLWRNLSRLGQAAGITGLLGVIFFFLPWSFTPNVNRTITEPTRSTLTASHSGWSTASGLPLLGGGATFNVFPHLWLVLISMLALIAIAALLAAQRITIRVAAMLITLISLFALLLEILFLVQINSFQGAMNDLTGGRLLQPLYGVSWGYWLSLAATVVALGVGAFMLYQEYVPGTPGRPRIPGGQRPYPTT